MASIHRGIALLIGISNYDYQENIDSALNDVLEMSRRLSACDYEVIEATNLEIVEIRVKVSLLMDRLDEFQHQEVLVYYAGHGLVVNDEHLIVGRRYDDNARSQSNEIIRKCLSVERDIIDKVCSISCIEEEETRSLAVILDTCRSKANVINRSIASSNFSSDSFKLRHEVRIGILVGYACALGLKAKDSGDGNHGLYTDCILKNIFEPGRRIIDALSSANFLAANRTNTGQRPFIYVNYPHFFHYSLVQSDHNNERDQLKLEKEEFEQKILRMKKKLANNRSENKEWSVKISDVDIMEILYESTQGALWTKNKGRLSWQLNSCTPEFKNANGKITYIELQKNNLIGMIPQELGRLSYLTTLNLSCNGLKGKIPVELGALRNLVDLYLHSNQLTDIIPVELGELTYLVHLGLHNNQLTGAIPVELGKLKNLVHLYLDGNKLTVFLRCRYNSSRVRETVEIEVALSQRQSIDR